MAPVQNRGPLEDMYYIFVVRKEIIKNDNSLAVISLSKVGENAFLEALYPIYKVESSYCAII